MLYVPAFPSAVTCPFSVKYTAATARTLNAKEGVFAAGEIFEAELTVIGERGHFELLHADKYTLSINLDNCTVVKIGLWSRAGAV